MLIPNHVVLIAKECIVFNTGIVLIILTFKNYHENLEELSSLGKKAKGHRLCIDFRYQE